MSNDTLFSHCSTLKEGMMIPIHPRAILTRSLNPLRLLLLAAAVLMMVQLAASQAIVAGHNADFGFDAREVAGVIALPKS